MASFTCPFCGITMPITRDTHQIRHPSFNFDSGEFYNNSGFHIDSSCISVDFYKCPECNNFSIIASNHGDYYKKNFRVSIIPKSSAKCFPEYIPLAIREDYEEAYSILDLSPKASASLARRCLQGMIRDFWHITKPRLIDEINELQSKVSQSQWKAIDSIRSIGNIGAHMEKDVNMIIDVDPNEAEKLLKLIELLIEKWYIARHDEEELCSEIVTIADNKKSQKKINSNS